MSEISTTFKEIKDECWSHHASEQFLKVLEEDTNPHRPHQSQPGSQGCAGGGGGGWRGGGGAVSAGADEQSPTDRVCNHPSKRILS